VPKAYLSTQHFNWTEESSLIVEQQGACSAPTYFYYFQSNDGGVTYQQFYSGTANQVALSYGNFAAGTQFDYAVYACDAVCSNPGYVIAYDEGPGQSNFTYTGQQWFYQNAGRVNDGGGYTGSFFSSSPSGADRYLGDIQTPEPGVNLTNITDAVTYIDAFTNDGVFYQVGYSYSPPGMYSSTGFSYFAATTYGAQGNPIVGYDQNGQPIRQWAGVGCAAGTSRIDYPAGTVRGITVRCDPPLTAWPNAQESYDVHAYTTVVYTGVNNSYILNVTELSGSPNNGYLYQADAVQEIIGAAASDPAVTMGQYSPSRAPDKMTDSYFNFNGNSLPGGIVSDYTISSDLFDAANHTTLPACQDYTAKSIQRETVAYPWGLRWDFALPDC
jgi:hypothetical protein